MEPISVTIGKMLGLLLCGVWGYAYHKEKSKKKKDKYFKSQMKDAGFSETDIQEWEKKVKSPETDNLTNQNK